MTEPWWRTIVGWEYARSAYVLTKESSICAFSGALACGTRDGRLNGRAAHRAFAHSSARLFRRRRRVFRCRPGPDRARRRAARVLAARRSLLLYRPVLRGAL